MVGYLGTKSDSNSVLSIKWCVYFQKGEINFGGDFTVVVLLIVNDRMRLRTPRFRWRLVNCLGRGWVLRRWRRFRLFLIQVLRIVRFAKLVHVKVRRRCRLTLVRVRVLVVRLGRSRV